ncbi:MAG: class I SAM-dependent methyltransferase [Kiritimatiellae bacterium]|nr:class I SAM-dependent methyltransferase [Kiritimatiellia bacterium]
MKGMGRPVPQGVCAYDVGKAAKLKVHYFKRRELLPRVRLVLGFLRSIEFGSLLDVGSGRGAFLWPFLESFPGKEVHVIDMLPYRAALFRAVAVGGISRLHAHEGDVRELALPDNAVDVVTMLEVLEHIPDVEGAVRNAVRIARRHIVVTVPSGTDDNPEHIHLLTKERLSGLFGAAGCAKLNFAGVPGHTFMVASC